MKTHDFYYDLPKERIAQTPVEPRDHSRLLVMDRFTGEMEHRHFYDIVDYLRKLGLPLEHISFWYIASAVQLGVNANSPLPLKSLYIELGRIYGVSPQGVESGLRRMGKTLTRLGVFSEAPSSKQLVATLVSAFLRERSESRDDVYAVKP